MQIKINLCHFVSIKLGEAFFFFNDNTQFWPGSRETGTIVHLLEGLQTGTELDNMYVQPLKHLAFLNQKSGFKDFPLRNETRRQTEMPAEL